MGARIEHAAWLSGAGVRSFVTEHRDVFRSLHYVLISRVGSARPDPAMPWLASLLEHPGRSVVSLTPLVVPGHVVVELADRGLLAGFDELWVLEGPVATAPPDGATIAAPVRVSGGVPDDVAEWVAGVSWRVGLGDGDGLNVLVADPFLGAQLRLVPAPDAAAPPGPLPGMEPGGVVSRDAVRRVLDAVLAGEVSREAASRWASPLYTELDDRTDEATADALGVLVGIDQVQLGAEGFVTGYQSDVAEVRELRAQL